ncbi:spermidine/putrescine ABC transporter permease [Hypericibacter terrae]|uniref:Spermidine/putrescine ABC transporter permease n=1 Tax=Hypericibacter terrae TaxID=2602015 RepID=A0A5J6MIE3_9PROT|nr:ABC transporter permease subunit [Hypericibacter terrae]QEX17268.1 spermidine/putrescine ABC transporter permease [Hypericibacter terrae]
MNRSHLLHLLAWNGIAWVLLLLYLPLVPPFLFSFSADGTVGGLATPTLRWYAELPNNPLLTKSIGTTLVVGIIVALATPPLALLGAMAVRRSRFKRLLLMMMLLPLFIPGVSLGLASAFFFRLLELPPSLWSIAVVQVLWALPFSTIIILTVMSTFDPVFLEAAYIQGANRWRAFIDIELPLIWPGLMGAAVFALILSFNETVRTALVQGPYNTIQTYIWATYLQVGLSPTLHALMSLLIALTLALVVVLLAFSLRQPRRLRINPAARSNPRAPARP